MRQLLPVATPLSISGGNREFSYDSGNPAEVASEALIFFVNSSTAPQNASTEVVLLL
ncbi:hypothetical protein M3I53_29675 [Paraburkholderia sp. CNPSo 3272]|uniref:hypothetical protein n=1 Tax=Paraburkholderia sp. CNPSo 3272 TaxID=2940931 RepID=UPI0020B849DD|nr:hypothetical protein [Paraburkholderia sp. CNPSo 3272]MCP3727244.1 hypothetical protein [Paraburkholderia sp. CNPSo 3272]